MWTSIESPGLADIREENGNLHIGCLTRESDLDSSELVRESYPILHDTTSVIADPLVRNMATVGGNLAHGDPANDHPATMIALGASVVATGSGGERVIPVADFFDGPLSTVLASGRSPDRHPRAHSSCRQRQRLHQAGTQGGRLRYRRRGRCHHHVRRGMPAGRHRPHKRRPDAGEGKSSAEAFLAGKSLDDDTIREAARLAASEAQPTADLRGSEEYKRDMVRVLTGRALRLALERAG